MRSTQREKQCKISEKMALVNGLVVRCKARYQCVNDSRHFSPLKLIGFNQIFLDSKIHSNHDILFLKIQDLKLRLIRITVIPTMIYLSAKADFLSNEVASSTKRMTLKELNRNLQNEGTHISNWFKILPVAFILVPVQSVWGPKFGSSEG